jgi:serine/threonine protein kinase
MYSKARLFDPVRSKNVYKEIEILKECDHPNIVKLRKVIESTKYVYLQF